MTQDELTAWATANGWQVIAGCPYRDDLLTAVCTTPAQPLS